MSASKIPRRRPCRSAPRRAACLALAGLAIAGSACVTTPAHERDWIALETRHFEVLSSLSRTETTELAQALEVLRAALGSFVTVEGGARGAGVPTRVVLFADAGSFRPFRAPGAKLGHFLTTQRANYILARRSEERLHKTLRGIATREVVFDGYVRLRAQRGRPVPPPPWVERGLASFLSTLRVEHAAVEVGGPPQRIATKLGLRGWMPLEELLAETDLDEQGGLGAGQFDAQAWALVHYLELGLGGERRFDGGLPRYLAALGRGAGEAEALQLAFGRGVDQLDRELRAYTRRGWMRVLRLPLEHFGAERAFHVRALAPSEVATALGRLSLQLGRPAQAQALFDAALRADPRHARAYSGLAVAHELQDQLDDAAALHQRALELAPDDAEVQLDAARHRHELARLAGDAETRRRGLREARRGYARAAELDSSIPEIHARLGTSFLVEGEDAARAVEPLERAHALLPSDLSIQLRLAEAYVRTGRARDAEPLLRTVREWSRDEDETTRARELMEGTRRRGASTGLRRRGARGRPGRLLRRGGVLRVRGAARAA